jgi:hypothetical protein
MMDLPPVILARGGAEESRARGHLRDAVKCDSFPLIRGNAQGQHRHGFQAIGLRGEPVFSRR